MATEGQQEKGSQADRWGWFWNYALVGLVLAGLVAVVLYAVRPELDDPAAWAGQPKTVTVRQYGGAPAPTLKRGPKVKYKGHLVASWVVSGAGDATYNGTYAESGTYNSQPAYTNGSRWLWWDSSISAWSLATAKGLPEMDWGYGSTGGLTLPSSPWGVSGGGTAPAPTVAGATVTPDWPWPWWDDDAPTFGANTPFAPCAATLAGTAYIVLPSNDATGAVYGFEIFNTTTHVWTHVAASGALFAASEFDPTQTGACFSVGDGVHIDVCSGVWDDSGTKKFTWKRFSVIPDGVATQTSTQDVTLDTQDITPFVEASVGNYRFVLMDTDHLHYCTYVAGASSYTAGVAIALPALDGGYTDQECGTGGPNDQVLLLRSAVMYWLRHARSGSTDRVYPYAIADGVVTPMDDLLAVQYPSEYWRQTWGNDPARGYVYGDLGNAADTTTGVATERWLPTTDGIPASPFATYPAQERWYLTTGGKMWVVGWFDADYEHQPFALDTTPIPNVVEDIHGIGVGTGTAYVHITPPVLLVEDGTGFGTGTAKVIGAVHLSADGVGVGTGTVVVQASGVQPPEGFGALAELQLTPGVWPGAVRRVAVPSWFERMNGRRYGGELPSVSLPSWNTPIDTINPLAQYVKFWSWCIEDPDDEAALYDASGEMGDGALIDLMPYSSCVVTGAPAGFNQSYEAVLANGMWTWQMLGADGERYLAPAFAYYPFGAWHLCAADGTVIATSTSWNAKYPWDATWGDGVAVVATTTTGRWGADGLVVRGWSEQYWSASAQQGAVRLPDDFELPGLSTWLFDVTLYQFPREVSDGGDDGTLFHHRVTPVENILTELCILKRSDMESWTVDITQYQGGSGAFFEERVEIDLQLQVRKRIVVSLEFGGFMSVYDNGVLVGTIAVPSQLIDASGLRTRMWLCGRGYPTVGTEDYYGPLPATVHEVGFLSGYAATAEDVATNPGLATPYGFRGTLLPMTDAPV